jgi:uncharacterized membrane protein YgdD (TMEM256/DUF423 family)
MPVRLAITLAALFLFVAVVAGAFGGHALKSRLAPDLMAIYQTACGKTLLHDIGKGG